MELSRQDAIALLTACGFATANRWAASRCLGKLQKFQELKGTDDFTEPTDGEPAKAYKQVLKALKKGEEIVVTSAGKGSAKPADDKPADPPADPAPAKGKKGKKGKGKKGDEPAPAPAPEPTPDKPAKGKGKKGKAAVPKSKGSNKETVYKRWRLDLEKADADEYHKLVKGAVQLQTIRNWISQWCHGTNYPACAKTAEFAPPDEKNLPTPKRAKRGKKGDDKPAKGKGKGKGDDGDQPSPPTDTPDPPADDTKKKGKGKKGKGKGKKSKKNKS